MKQERIEQVRQALVNKVVPLSKKAEYARIFECGVAWADENPVNPWISVEERLPEEDKDVFVRKTCTNGIFHMTGKVLNGGKWYCYGFGWQDSGVITHWMPIPSLKRDEEEIDDPRLTEKQKKELGYK